jgi:hypothetical protein
MRKIGVPRHISAFRPRWPDRSSGSAPISSFVLSNSKSPPSTTNIHERGVGSPQARSSEAVATLGDGSDCEPQYPCPPKVTSSPYVFRSSLANVAISLWSRADEQEYTCACESGPVLFLSGHGNHDRPTFGPFLTDHEKMDDKPIDVRVLALTTLSAVSPRVDNDVQAANANRHLVCVHVHLTSVYLTCLNLGGTYAVVPGSGA